MFTIVTHNAVGTVHSFVRGFATVEQAEGYWERWHHTGLGSICLVIDAADEDHTRRVNSVHDPANRYLISEGRRARLQAELEEFIRRVAEAGRAEALARTGG